MDKKRSDFIVKASWVGIAGNAILAIAKVIAGFLSGSLAVIGDGIDSATDVLTFVITMIAAKFVIKPPNKRYPYGYKRAETVAANILALIIFFVGAQLLLSSVSRLFFEEYTKVPSNLAIYVTLFSIAGKMILAWWQFRAGKRVNSTMLRVNAVNMRNDIIISCAVLIGLMISIYYQIPQVDLILGILVSLWIIKVGIEILMDTNRELMDGLKNTGIYKKIIEVVDNTEGVDNPHRIRIRQHSYMYVIGLDIEVDPEMSVKESHNLANKLQENILENVDNVYDIMVHIEPHGNDEDEQFGISKYNIQY